MFGGPPKSEEVEKVESPGNSRTNLRRREEGHGFLEVEKIEKLEIAVFDGCPKSEEVEIFDLLCKSKS